MLAVPAGFFQNIIWIPFLYNRFNYQEVNFNKIRAGNSCAKYLPCACKK
jgi:hypothetical protein